MESAKAVLKRYWGYPSFRGLQEEIIQSVVEKKDVLALMPTGGGKSICFQIPALLQEGVCLVVTPLIALMQDQVVQLRQQGLSAAALHTGMYAKEMDIILDNCVYGRTKFLYLSPERLQTELFQARVAQMKVCLLAIDEAHCISQWGHDFRPAYRNIAAIKPLLGDANVIAVTATATSEVKQDIISMLGLQKPVVLQKSFARTNLALSVQKVEDKTAALFRWLHKVGGSAIVYAGSRKETRWIADYLQDKGISATYYHAGLDSEERSKRQAAWLKEAVRVMVATNAFGMGINKPNVRLVVHLHFPPTLEAYYQEAGRAGRDGKAAYAAVLYEPSQVEHFIQKMTDAYPTSEILKKVYQRLANYYQIAIGSHAGVSYPFDLEDFADTYGMKIPLLYTVLQRLQDAQLIQYNDRSAKPAQVYVTTSAQQLYAFQVRNPPYDPLIRALNHLYGTHIFTELTQISLKRLAKQLQTTQKSLHHAFKEMEALNLLSYLPAQQHASLTFLTPRYAIESLPISSKALLGRKKVMQNKAKRVIHYMEHDNRCRTQLLLEYLGEISYQQCNLCDICKSKKEKKPFSQTAYALYRKKILSLLTEKPLTPNALIENLEKEVAREDILDTLRRMMETCEISYTNQFELTTKPL